jgi:poly(3-hydroxyoctanoate) depolymerase
MRCAFWSTALLIMTTLACENRLPWQNETDGGVSCPEGHPSRCCQLDDELICPYETRRLEIGLAKRAVHWQQPLGEPPDQGWPAVLLFQGSYLPPAEDWANAPGGEHGVYHQTRTIEALLDAGFTVLTPETRREGATYWDSNTPPYSLSWETAPDHQLMLELFDALEAGEFGPVDGDRLYAAGISSGGYMTSRMALAYPGRFRALAIQSASYATCAASICSVPASLPADHPPTLFLHGERDSVVPMSTMTPYADGLEAAGVEVRVVTDAEAGHEWLNVAPAEVTSWFETAR